MKLMEATTIIGYIVGAIGAVLILTSKTKTDNLADLKQRVEILEKEREYLREERERERQAFKKEMSQEIETRNKLHLENQKSISNLEGQLATYKEIPLRQIDDSLAKLAESNDEILRTLQGSAEVAENEAKAGGLLVHTKDTRPLAVKPVTGKKLKTQTS